MMRRIIWPINVPPVRITPLGGPKSLGFTESVTSDIQTVQQPYGLLRYQFDFPSLRGRYAADVMGWIAAMEDGANWSGVPCLFPSTPGWRDLGLQLPPARIPWSNGQPFDNGQYWSPSKPIATVAANAAIDAREVQINVTNWNGNIWRGFQIGFAPEHFGMYIVQEVSLAGNIATCRIWPRLRKAVTTTDLVTLKPVVAVRNLPGSSSAGQRVGRHVDGISITFVEVPNDIIEAYGNG